MLVHDASVPLQAMVSDGVKIDAFPSSLTLPALSDPQQFLLLAIPMEAGELNVQGYEATVFGVHNKCMVKIPGDWLVDVLILLFSDGLMGSVSTGAQNLQGVVTPIRLSLEPCVIRVAACVTIQKTACHCRPNTA